VRAALIAVLFVGAYARCAGAEEPNAKTQARTHFRAGTVFFEAASYDRAIEEYREAYNLLPLPDFLFNIAQAYRLQGDSKSAVEYYNRYLKLKPTGAIADEARVHLHELAAAPETANPPPAASKVPSAAGNPPPARASESPAAALAPPTHEPAATAPPEPAMAATADARAHVDRRARPRWLIPVVVVGSVLVVGAVGLGVGLGVSGPRYPSPSFGETMPR
jgi:iron complex outermembrane receptor protein